MYLDTNNKFHKKSEAKFTAGVLKKISETLKRLNRTLINETKQDMMQIFKGILPPTPSPHPPNNLFLFRAHILGSWKNPTGSR